MRIDMSCHIQAVLNEASNDMNETAITPAEANLFDVNMDNPVYTDATKADMFHRIKINITILISGDGLTTRLPYRF